MTTVEFFASMEEAMQRLEEARLAADARVRGWQAAAKPGDCFITIAEDALVVFGEVLETYGEPRVQHYRFCRCHSVACPEGELGDVHVSTIACFISRAAFEEARRGGWSAEVAGGDPGCPGPACAPSPAPRSRGGAADCAASPPAARLSSHILPSGLRPQASRREGRWLAQPKAHGRGCR